MSRIIPLLDYLLLRTWRRRKPRIEIDASALSSEIWQRHWRVIDRVPGWLSQEEALLLHCLASRVSDSGEIVEIGSYLGRSTIALAASIEGNSTLIHAIDPHTGDITQVSQGQTIDTWDCFRQNLIDSGHAKKILPQRTTSRTAALTYSGKPVELLFIDGWHATDAILEDLLLWRPHLAAVCTIIFDDWGELPVARAIQAIEDVLPPCRGYQGKDLVYSHLDLRVLNPKFRN